jgi:hypothetical protein
MTDEKTRLCEIEKKPFIIQIQKILQSGKRVTKRDDCSCSLCVISKGTASTLPLPL